MDSVRIFSRLWVIGFVCIGVTIGAAAARAGSDPDVDAAIAILDKVDGLTKDQFATYKAALEKYADNRQRCIQGLGKLVESDQPEIKGPWDQICDGGIAYLSELVKVAPSEKTKLQKFYDDETKTWEALKKLELAPAEEAETRTRRLVQAVIPVIEKKIAEIDEEDKKNDERMAKARENRKKTVATLIAGARILNQLNPEKMTKTLIEEILKNIELVKAAIVQIVVEVRSDKQLGAANKQLALTSGEIHKGVTASTEEMTKKVENAKSGMKQDAIQSQRGVASQTEGWAKMMDAHAQETMALVKRFNDMTQGRVVGDANADTKAKLGDYEAFKSDLSEWEEEGKTIESALTDLDKKIEELRDGELKTSLKDGLNKCRDLLKECASLRADMKSEFEGGLSDNGLK